MEFYANSHQLQKPPKLQKHDVDQKIDEDIEETEDEQIEVQFRSEKGDTSFPAFSVPKSVTNDKLKLLLQAFKKSCPVSAWGLSRACVQAGSPLYHVINMNTRT